MDSVGQIHFQNSHPVVHKTSHFRSFIMAVGCFWLLAASSLAQAPPAVVATKLPTRPGEAAAYKRPFEQKLAEFDIPCTSAGVAAYLQSLMPTAQRQAALRQQIVQLGSEDFQQREMAMRSLLREPTAASTLLEEATRSEDPEVRWRSKQLIFRSQRDGKVVLQAALTAVAADKMPHLALPIIDAAVMYDEPYLRLAARKALAATVDGGDVTLLRQRLASPQPLVREHGLQALAAVLKESVANDALGQLSDKDDAVSVAAARILASLGRRESLVPLVRLLSSTNVGVRIEAIKTLRGLTAQTFGFTVYETVENRQVAVKQWQAWLAREGGTFKLQVPLTDARLDLGRLLVCDTNQSKVLEFNEKGEKVWERQVGLAPWGCQGLPNGHRLICCYQQSLALEFDEKGEEVWRSATLPACPQSIERLDNGNTLLACSEAGKIIEINAASDVVWSAKVEGRPVDAHRLEDGNTLVSLQIAQAVVEIDQAGRTVWQLPGQVTGFSAQRLATGATIVPDLRTNEVLELDRDGFVLWSLKKGLTTPYSAQRLETGNTLVADRTGIQEFDPAGKVVRSIPLQNIYRFHRY